MKKDMSVTVNEVVVHKRTCHELQAHIIVIIIIIIIAECSTGEKFDWYLVGI